MFRMPRPIMSLLQHTAQSQLPPMHSRYSFMYNTNRYPPPVTSLEHNGHDLHDESPVALEHLGLHQNDYFNPHVTDFSFLPHVFTESCAMSAPQSVFVQSYDPFDPDFDAFVPPEAYIDDHSALAAHSAPHNDVYSLPFHPTSSSLFGACTPITPSPSRAAAHDAQGRFLRMSALAAATTTPTRYTPPAPEPLDRYDRAKERSSGHDPGVLPGVNARVAPSVDHGAGYKDDMMEGVETYLEAQQQREGKKGSTIPAPPVRRRGRPPKAKSAAAQPKAPPLPSSPSVSNSTVKAALSVHGRHRSTVLSKEGRGKAVATPAASIPPPTRGPTPTPIPTPSSSTTAAATAAAMVSVPYHAGGRGPRLACLFCRGRKIACGPPHPESGDPRCNQCTRRDIKCEYPTECRRGMRKKMIQGPRLNVKIKAASRGSKKASPYRLLGKKALLSPAATATAAVSIVASPAAAAPPES